MGSIKDKLGIKKATLEYHPYPDTLVGTQTPVVRIEFNDKQVTCAVVRHFVETLISEFPNKGFGYPRLNHHGYVIHTTPPTFSFQMQCEGFGNRINIWAPDAKITRGSESFLHKYMGKLYEEYGE